MSTGRRVYLGIDGGAPLSKGAGVWDDGTAVSIRLLQRPTNAGQGPEAVVRAWADAAAEFLDENGQAWGQVEGVGLAIPGPYQRYGVFDRSANLPESFIGFDVYAA